MQRLDEYRRHRVDGGMVGHLSHAGLEGIPTQRQAPVEAILDHGKVVEVVPVLGEVARRTARGPVIGPLDYKAQHERAEEELGRQQCRSGTPCSLPDDIANHPCPAPNRNSDDDPYGDVTEPQIRKHRHEEGGEREADDVAQASPGKTSVVDSRQAQGELSNAEKRDRRSGDVEPADPCRVIAVQRHSGPHEQTDASRRQDEGRGASVSCCAPLCVGDSFVLSRRTHGRTVSEGPGGDKSRTARSGAGWCWLLGWCIPQSHVSD